MTTMYRIMSKEEIEIRQISDLKMLHLYQLNGSDAIAVYYGEQKQLNLCALDDHYNLLIEKVLSLYSECTDKDSIVIEETTKELLEQAISHDNHHTSFFNKIGKKYMNQEAFLCPRFISDGTIRDTMIPMIRYYLQQLYHMWNMDISFEQEPISWHRNGILKARKNNETFIMPLRLTIVNDNEYKISVGNFIHNYSAIEFHISYHEDQFIVYFESTKPEIFGESFFKWNQPQPKAYTTISIGKRIAYHQDEQLKELAYTDNNLQLAFDKKTYLFDVNTDFTQINIFQFPWNSCVILCTNQTQNEHYHQTDFDTIYTNTYHSKLVLRHYSYSLVENKSDRLKLRTNGAVMRKIYYGDKHPEIETYFMPVGYYSSWDYREYLENKYFYHTTEEAQS